MSENSLTPAEKARLLQEARRALELGVLGQPLDELDLEGLPARLRQDGASFVTLTRGGFLRGCIGTIEAHQPLIEDVRQHAVDAALNDYRFPPVSPGELAEIEIEVSYLTPQQPLEYGDPEKLADLLRPGIDGVVLRDGLRRSTFLPQVWEKIPDAERFLSELCQKMGAAPDLWRRKVLDVSVYQVEKFYE